MSEQSPRQETCAVPDQDAEAAPSRDTDTVPFEATDPGDASPEAPSGDVVGRVPRDRGADRAAVRAFRPHRRIPALVVAALMTLLALLIAAETISALAGVPLRLVPYDGMLSWATSTPWTDPLFLAGSAIVALVGLGLLAAALVPGRPGMVPVRSGDPDVIIGLRTRSVTRALAHAAEEVPGVHSARARIRGRTIAVKSATSGWDKERFTQEVRGAVLTRLAGMDPVRPYRVDVHVKERK